MLSEKQKAMYWRVWESVEITKGWRHESAQRRKELRHEFTRQAGIVTRKGAAKSMNDFTNSDFSRWISATAPLRNDIDIRDRDRENAIHAIQRISNGISEILKTQPGQYEREILIDFSDTVDLDAIEMQNAEMRDLENIKMTMHNRLSRLLTKVKQREIHRPDLLAAWRDETGSSVNATTAHDFVGNNRIIASLISGKPLTHKLTKAPKLGRPYTLNPAKKFQPQPAPIHETNPF